MYVFVNYVPKLDLLWHTAAGFHVSCQVTVSLNITWIFLAVDCPSSVVPPDGSPCHSICTGPLPLVCWLLSNQNKFTLFGHFPSVTGASRKQRSTHTTSMGPKAEWDIFIAPFNGGHVCELLDFMICVNWSRNLEKHQWTVLSLQGKWINTLTIWSKIIKVLTGKKKRYCHVNCWIVR